MSDFLRRFSVSLDRQEQAKSSNHPTADVQGKGRDIPSTHSFNDFSMHVGQECKLRNTLRPVALVVESVDCTLRF